MLVSVKEDGPLSGNESFSGKACAVSGDLCYLCYHGCDKLVKQRIIQRKLIEAKNGI